MLLKKSLYRMAAVVGVWGVLQTAGAGTLQLQVQDKNGKPLPDAIVFLESAEAKAAAKPLKGVEVAQIGRQFKPAVTVVTPGTSILFPNQDTVRHHVYSFSPAKTFELKLYAGVPANPVVFDKVGIAVLGCNIHDNMVAWVLVVDTPYFGHTDAQGKVTLGDVPNGSYKLRTWHASLPTGAPAAEQAQAVGASPATVLVKLAGEQQLKNPLFRFYAHWGIGTKFLVLSVAMLLLVQIAVYSVVRSSINSNVRAQLAQELAIGDKVWWRLLDQNAQKLRLGASVLAADYGFRSALSSGDTETLRSALENSGARIGAPITALLDTGFTLQAVGFEMDVQTAMAPVLQKLAAELSQTEQSSQLQLINTTLYQFVMVPLKAPLTIGWVLMGFPLEQSQANDMFGLSSIHVALVRPQGGVVLSSLPSKEQASLSQLGLGTELQVPGGTLVVRRSTERTDVNAVDTYLLRSLDEVVAPYLQVQIALLGITALGLALFLVGSATLARRITTPLRSLVGAAEQLSRGEYEHKLPALRHKDEIGDLARAFDHMRSSIRKQQGEILQLAYWDRLTGLPNRTQFRDLLQQSIRASMALEGAAPPVAVVLLNLDRFKHVNDVLGYAFGDGLLVAVAQRLNALITDEMGVVARMGGDEFAVLIEGNTAEDALAIAKKIAASFDQPLTLEDQTVDFSAGIGVASWPAHAQDVDTLLSRAEIAMYVAKQKTTGIQIYDPALDSSSTQTLSLLTELRHAVEEGQLRLYLQPKLNLADNTVLAAEALVRWQHPTRGLVPPMQFIPFAEQTGFVRQLTLWMFEEVARALPSLRADGRPLRVAINLSTRDLLDQDFPAKLDAMMAKYNAPTDAFCLEITESAIMDDPQRAEATLNRLAERGSKLSIDDFGTGYSSLAYLKRLPVNELKIDKSFVMGMEKDESDAKIVRSTIDLAHNLGLSVVAEGVENQAILDKLRELSCDEAQGYYMSKPIPLADFITWRAKHAAAA